MRKVLSFVLVLALVLSSFSMAFADTTPAAVTTTPAATTAPVVTTPAPVVAPTQSTATNVAGLSDIAGNANEQAIVVANNLGIVLGNPDGTFAPDKAVNRAEFAAMITRALGIPQSALAGYTKASFKDITGYGWATSYLAFCESKGIMKGDGLGNVMPGRTINTNEAATMICRAVGYTDNSAVLVGVWPSNFVSLAQDLGIYDDVAKDVTVERNDAAQMIYNALTAQKVQVAADGTTTNLKDLKGNAITMLTSGLGCELKYQGVVTYDADAVINTVPYIGDYAKVYKNADSKVVVIDEIDSTAIKADYNQATGAIATNNVFIDADDVEYTVSSKATTGAIDYFLNGHNVSAYNCTKDASYTINVELSNKNITDFYSIEDWTVSAAAKIVAGDLAALKDSRLLGYDFATDKKDKVVANSYQLIGAKSLEDIKADSVVYIYEDATDKEIRKVAVGTAVVEGKVTKVNSDASTWTINGKAYDFAFATGQNGASKAKDELGNEVKVWLDAYGDIYKYEAKSGSAKNYAVLVALDTQGTSDGNMKLYLADDSKKTFSSDLSSDDWDFVKTQVTTAALSTKGRIVGYGLDKSGQIDSIYPAHDSTDYAWYKAATGTAIMPNNAVLKVMSPVAGGAAKQLVVASDAVVFTYEANGVVDGVSKVANIEKDATAKLTGAVEALVRDGEVVAMIVDQADVTGSTTDSYAVVDGYKNALNPAGDKAQVLTGFIDGKPMAKDSVFTSGLDKVTTCDKVNVYKLKYNDDKNISKLEQQTPVLGTANLAGTAGAIKITENGYTSDRYIKTGVNGADLTAVADDAVYYEVTFDGTVDEYKIFNGTIYAGMYAWAYDTDTDKAGAEIVIICKAGVKTYDAPTLTLGTAATITSASAIGTEICTLSYTGTGASVDVAVTGGVTNFNADVSGAAIAVTGQATAMGTATVTVTVTDANNNTVVKAFNLTIN